MISYIKIRANQLSLRQQWPSHQLNLTLAFIVRVSPPECCGRNRTSSLTNNYLRATKRSFKNKIIVVLPPATTTINSNHHYSQPKSMKVYQSTSRPIRTNDGCDQGTSLSTKMDPAFTLGCLFEISSETSAAKYISQNAAQCLPHQKCTNTITTLTTMMMIPPTCQKAYSRTNKPMPISHQTCLHLSVEPQHTVTIKRCNRSQHAVDTCTVIYKWLRVNNNYTTSSSSKISRQLCFEEQGQMIK